MAVNITFLGHAGFVLDDGQHAIAIDPFLTGNPVAKHAPEDIRCTHVALTHGHEDHFGDDTINIARRNEATVIAPFEIANYCGEQGIENLEPGNPGGRIGTPFGWVAFTQALHSSSYKGQYMGLPCGVVVNIGGLTFYHTGDTCLFSDLELIGRMYKPDVAAICAGDRFTMGPEHAARAAEMIGAKTAIPIHFGTWPLLVEEISAFQPKGVEVKVMAPAETWKRE